MFVFLGSRFYGEVVLLAHVCKAVCNLRSKRAAKNAVKRSIVNQYDYAYYLRDRLWNKIKEPKPGESAEQWQRRLWVYEFGIDGTDYRNGGVHTPPMVVPKEAITHLYYRSPLDPPFANPRPIPIQAISGERFNMNTKLSGEENVYDELLNKLQNAPGDFSTRKGLWFCACVVNDKITIERASNHAPSCNVNHPRKLDPGEASAVYDAYLRYGKTSMAQSSRNASYWFALFGLLER